MKMHNNEISRILFISTLGALIFSVTGIFLGIISNSDMVLLDGLYAVLSLLISALSLFTSITIKKPNRESFPFGKYIFQPLTIVFNSSILLLLCILSLISSIYAIMQGGRNINANIGLFYGIFSFVGCGVICFLLSRNRKKSDLISALSLFTSITIKKPNRESFPFGKYIFQPLTIVFNSSILLLLCILSLISSIYAIMQGGRNINANIGLFYGIFSFVGCGVICFLLSRNRKKSDLIYAEMLQWLLDTFVSFGLVLGFILMFILKYTKFDWLIPYIDPFLVLIAGIILIVMPIRLLYKNGKEIISMSASEEVQYDIYNIVKKKNIEYNIRDEDIRISKMGQVIYIDLQNIVDRNSYIQTIEQADVYRNEIIEEINQNFINFDKWLNISFTEKYYSRQIN